jgi:hypothetical protein
LGRGRLCGVGGEGGLEIDWNAATEGEGAESVGAADIDWGLAADGGDTGAPDIDWGAITLGAVAEAGTSGDGEAKWEIEVEEAGAGGSQGVCYDGQWARGLAHQSVG